MEYMIKATAFIVFISIVTSFIALVIWMWRYYRDKLSPSANEMARFGADNLSQQQYKELMDDYVKRKDSQSSKQIADINDDIEVMDNQRMHSQQNIASGYP